MKLQAISFLKAYDWALSIAGTEMYAVTCDFPFGGVSNRQADVPGGEFPIPGGAGTRVVTFQFYDVDGGPMILDFKEWFALAGGNGQGPLPLKELARDAVLSVGHCGATFSATVLVIPDGLLSASFSQESNLLTVTGSLVVVGEQD